MKTKSILIILSLVLFTACTTVQLPQNQMVNQGNVHDLKSQLPIYPKDKVPYQNVANPDITNVKLGDKNLYDITITEDLKNAYDGYLSGDGEKALKALDNIFNTSKDDKILWQASFLKVQVLIMQGLGSDALAEINTCSKYEKKSFNSNLNCTALRGELNAWLEDYDEAKKDASNVLLTIGSWEFPTSYKGPPSNMPNLVATTTAQMRAYTTLAALYNLQENYKESYYWANEAEKRMNSVHYVSNHWLYGKFVNLHLDSYYGRAMNLTFLATAKLALGFDKKEVNDDFIKAIRFFEMINYKKGIATVLALKARVYNKLGRHDMCYVEGKKALDYAVKNGFLDFVWRIEAIRADTFLQKGLKDEAKAAYRRANDTVLTLTGALSSDSAKRKFGIGKDDISYNLIKFDIEEKDYEQLFIDLETSRARAFVDMLGKRTVNIQRDNSVLKKIQSLDKQIQKQSILNTASGEQKAGIKKLQDLLHNRIALEKELQASNPKLATAVSIWSSSLSKTQSNLKDNESMIYFIPLKEDENLQYLQISENSVELKTLQISQNKIKKELSKLSSALGISTLLSSRAIKIKKEFVTNKIKEPKSINKIIANLQKKLQVQELFNTNKTYIIPSGITHFVPWGMLNTQSKFAFLPNGNWINYKDIQIDSSNKIVIVANPNFHGQLPQLNGAQKEAKELEKLYDSQALIFDDATLAKLTQNIGSGVESLHLATHGIFYKDAPLNSAIYLANNKALSAKELFQNPLKSNLVVLSACETGLGVSSSGEDLMGLNRSFFLGGTKTILSSLWQIDDEGTKEFMTIFHKYAKDGHYANGYQKARESLKNKGYSPAIYGAFVLNGFDKNIEK